MLVMLLPQIAVLGLLQSWDFTLAAALVATLIAGQFLAMLRFLQNPSCSHLGITALA